MAQKTDAEWRETLTPQQYKVLRQHGTEPPGSSPLNIEKRDGTFSCAGCGQPLFSADTKFESGTGWPSFFRPLENSVETTTDQTLGHDQGRSPLRELRRPPRPRVSRWSAADRACATA